MNTVNTNGAFKSLIKRHKWLVPVIILSITLLIIALLIATKPKPPKQESQEKAWLISAQHIHLEAASPQIQLLGQVESPFDSTLSAAISADVLDVAVRDGQVVQKGDILIELDAREIDQIVVQRQADVAELKAQIIAENNRHENDKASLIEDQKLLELAVKGVKRQAKLKAANLVAQERFDTAESQRAQQALSVNARKLNIQDHSSRLNQLKARLSRAETALSNSVLDAEHAHIKAPFNGVITGIEIAPGERVQVGQALVSLYDRHNLEIRAQMPDHYISLVRKSLEQGSVIKAKTLNFGEQTALQLERLAGSANRGAGGIDALFIPAPTESSQLKEQIPTAYSPQHTLILHSTLKLQVDLPPLSGVVTLPISAIYGSNRIYRIEKGRLQSLTVSILGKRLSESGNNDRVIIGSKLLQEGDAIATTQLPNAISGLKVIERGGENAVKQ